MKTNNIPVWSIKLKTVRQKFLLIHKELSELTDIPQSTISKLENGIFIAPSFWKLVDFYFQYKKINPLWFINDSSLDKEMFMKRSSAVTRKAIIDSKTFLKFIVKYC